MKPFLVLQLRPEDETSDNEFEAFLKYGELKLAEVERIRVEQVGIPELNLDNYAGIIVGGSPFDVSKPESEKSDLQKKIEQDFDRLLGQVVEKDFPFLGACSGNSLLGKYCKASISDKFREDLAGVSIHLTEEGQKDPLLTNLPSTFRAIAGHKEACDDTPPGAVLLATSENCPVQMFRVGENVYATQFHPEADAQGIGVRIDAYKHHGYFKAEEAEQIKALIAKESTSIPQKILKRFVARYRSKL